MRKRMSSDNSIEIKETLENNMKKYKYKEVIPINKME